MKAQMIYHRSGAISGRRLAAFMGIGANRSGSMPERPDYLIRYGSTARSDYRPRQATLNRRRMLRRYSNRLEELERLKAGGVRVPEFSASLPIIAVFDGIIARDFPDDQQSTGGRGITFYSGGEQVDADHDLYMRLIDKDRQFRVHVIRGETRIRELIPDIPENRDKPVWNLDAGFTFRVPDGDVPPQVMPFAVQAIASLRLDFGAVDVITLNGMAYVLEVNTAPGLADPTLEWYAERLSRIMGIDSMPGWDAVEEEA